MRQSTALLKLVAVSGLLCGALSCSRSDERSFAEIGKRFGFSTSSGFEEIHHHSWTYTSALEGWSRTRIALVKAYASPEAMRRFLAAFSNRTDIVEMPEAPVVDSTLTKEASWW